MVYITRKVLKNIQNSLFYDTKNRYPPNLTGKLFTSIENRLILIDKKDMLEFLDL